MSSAKEWFNENGSCFQHRIHYLNSLIILLLKKNAIWCKEILIKQYFQERVQNFVPINIF